MTKDLTFFDSMPRLQCRKFPGYSNEKLKIRLKHQKNRTVTVLLCQSSHHPNLCHIDCTKHISNKHNVPIGSKNRRKQIRLNLLQNEELHNFFTIKLAILHLLRRKRNQSKSAARHHETIHKNESTQ